MTSLLSSLIPKTRRGRALFLLLLLFSATLFLSRLGAYRDFVRAESYFALGSRLMLTEGNWLAPHAPDEPVLNKPPLQYWLTGISYKMFGTDYGTARLPSALAALFVLGLVYILGERLQGRMAGLLAAAMLSTSYLFYTFARTAMSDMLLTMFVTGALACFILVLSEKTSRPVAVALCGYVLIALGVLTKGPVAVVLVAAPIMLEMLVARDLRLLKKLRLLSGTALVVALTAPYFLLLYLKLGHAPLRAFFIGENLQRFTGAIYAYGARPVWYLIAAMFSDFAPWSLVLPLASYVDWRARPAEKEERRTRRLLYFWLLLPLLFFSFSNFKLDYYLLPAMPAAALICGRLAARAHQLLLRGRIFLYTFTILFAAVLTSAALVSMRIAAALHLDASLTWLTVVASGAALLLVLYCVLRGWPRRATLALAGGICLTLLIYEWTLAPAFGRFQPVGKLAASAPARGSVYTSHMTSAWANTLAFHLEPGRVVTRLAPDEDAARLKEVLRNEPESVALVADEEYVRLLEDGIPLRSLADGETFGHSGLTFDVLRNPRRERLRIVQGAEK